MEETGVLHFLVRTHLDENVAELSRAVHCWSECHGNSADEYGLLPQSALESTEQKGLDDHPSPLEPGNPYSEIPQLPVAIFEQSRGVVSARSLMHDREFEAADQRA